MSWEGFLVRVWALAFAFFLLAWHASGEAAISKHHEKTLFFCGSQTVRAFFADTAQGKKFEAAGCQKLLEKVRKNEAREAKKKSTTIMVGGA